ncbi:hypothetical protein F7Q92_11985 [Ideonella dechloratans]|uniref:Uncharacterized protein n=1 Tax=Ideonella dechloratans TaxID=36863 RepID=A0A643FB56_IDEDE|nr:hypothetical protein F7Q92_11985 [Ideonella dechloratans]
MRHKATLAATLTLYRPVPCPATSKSTSASTTWTTSCPVPVASGQPTWAERQRLHNALVLFNPAPVT